MFAYVLFPHNVFMLGTWIVSDLTLSGYYDTPFSLYPNGLEFKTNVSALVFYLLNPGHLIARLI